MTLGGTMTTQIDTRSGVLRAGRFLPIPFAVLSMAGLALWFSGIGDADLDSVQDLDDAINSKGGAFAGASLIIVAMVLLIAFCVFVRQVYQDLPLVVSGATVLGLGGVAHLVENVLVWVLLGGDVTKEQGLWDVITALSFTAFGLLGIGAVLISIGIPGPRWLQVLGVVAGVLNILSGLGYFIAALWDNAPPPVLIIVWLILFGLWSPRHRRSTTT
jgi:hypothetical protein